MWSFRTSPLVGPVSVDMYVMFSSSFSAELNV